ncbi:MAG: YqjF family protein [Phycisphaerales bacterium]
MAMRWHDLLFMHWPIQASRLRKFVSPELEIEEFDGTAWLGVVPFRMSGVRHRLMPPVPGHSAFPELNVRTYVRSKVVPERAGVWFFSLDATSRIAVRVARATFGLAYMDARISCRTVGEGVEYQSRRTDRHGALAYGEAATREAELVVGYQPTGAPTEPHPGSVESFLTDRYCLYARRRGRLVRGEIDHEPWRLQPAAAKIEANTMAAPIGMQDLAEPALLHFARELDVRAWLPEAVV